MTTTLYGIPNCDSVKKARAWFDVHQRPYTFHDFKKQGVPQAALSAWIAALGWEALLNKKGTTWRKLDAATQSRVTDAPSAQALMLAHPSVIKRPVVTQAERITVGYVPQDWV